MHVVFLNLERACWKLPSLVAVFMSVNADCLILDATLSFFANIDGCKLANLFGRTELFKLNFAILFPLIYKLVNTGATTDIQ